MIPHHFWTLETRFAFTFIAAWEISAVSIGITVIRMSSSTFVIINTFDAVIVIDDRSVFGKSFITRTFIAATIVDAVSMMRTLNSGLFVLGNGVSYLVNPRYAFIGISAVESVTFPSSITYTSITTNAIDALCL